MVNLMDEQWEVVRPLVPVPSKRTDGCGIPRVEDRKILDGILWIMRTGVPGMACQISIYPIRPVIVVFSLDVY